MGDGRKTRKPMAVELIRHRPRRRIPLTPWPLVWPCCR